MKIIMKKRKNPFIPILMAAGFFAILVGTAIAEPQQDEEELEPQKGMENNIFADENENCFECHGEKYYTIKDTLFGEEKTDLMCGNNYFPREEFYHSVHWSFSCLDCHSEEYNQFPHPLSVRFEDYWTCLDCHGYDENFAQFNFEEIDAEHMKSVHYVATDGEFSCWKCHDPHTYNLLTRSTKEISEIIVESNNICLECHGNEDVFGMLSTRELGNVVPQHDWLPNQSLHFKAVRCIECHAEVNDSILVAHHIQPADSAVRNCVECHSKNSILMGTLYKYKAQETREEQGFINGVIISNDAYVIGANRSRVLNVASLVIFGLALAAIALHTILRILIIKRKK
jgi:hypothetical protein